jgi:hypothetical protein
MNMPFLRLLASPGLSASPPWGFCYAERPTTKDNNKLVRLVISVDSNFTEKERNDPTGLRELGIHG